MPIEREPWRFFDPARGIPDPTAAPSGTTAVVRLERIITGQGLERFRLRQTLAYLDRDTGRGFGAPADLELGDDDGEPGESKTDTDLTSVPDVFAWLVPKTGNHLPAAIIHDAMIGDPEYVVYERLDDAPSVDGFAPRQVVWRPGQTEVPPYRAVDADRIFRDAMADSGTGVIRRWLIWTAVTLRTIFSLDGTSPSRAGRWYYALVAGATLLSIVWLGYQATAQILDRSGAWWCSYELPWITSELPWGLDGLAWIGEGGGARLASGALFAFVLPVIAGVAWLKFWRAGMIFGIALAVLYHVTLALVALTLVFRIADTIATPGRSLVDLVPRSRTTWIALTGAIVAGALIVVVCRVA
ncbi:MAG: DUF1353 domain-containing protein [Ilumatobacter sp.]|nr:DUF1353 domain-containing protein [Ilumatobacter sp.]